jgi:hypothetical protein
MEEKLTVLPYEINPVKTQVLKVESRMLWEENTEENLHKMEENFSRINHKKTSVDWNSEFQQKNMYNW